MSDAAEPAPALKEIFNAARLLHIADEAAAVSPAFDAKLFLDLTHDGLDDLSLMQRLRRVSSSLHAALPLDFRGSLDVLRALAPRLNSGFVTLVLPEYVALYGADDFDASMDALAFFTRFGSSEFAIRPFLRADLDRTLRVMEGWSRDDNEHVRRLASEGSRPRLPWSFRIDALVADPTPTAPILENLKTDPSLYVRKSVANHLNDITKDHPGRVLDRIEGWSLDDPRTAWIARHALRTLVKKGDRRALAVLGAGEAAAVTAAFEISPRRIALGDAIVMTIRLTSTSAAAQRLVVDYAIHYVKKSGATSAKVFKLKTIDLAPGATADLVHRQQIRNFTTRLHYPGEHKVDLLVNGDILGSAAFELS